MSRAACCPLRGSRSASPSRACVTAGALIKTSGPAPFIKPCFWGCFLQLAPITFLMSRITVCREGDSDLHLQASGCRCSVAAYYFFILLSPSQWAGRDEKMTGHSYAVYIGHVEEGSGCVFAWGFVRTAENKVLQWTKIHFNRLFSKSCRRYGAVEWLEMNTNPTCSSCAWYFERRRCSAYPFVMSHRALISHRWLAAVLRTPSLAACFYPLQTCRKIRKPSAWTQKILWEAVNRGLMKMQRSDSQ